MKKSDLKDGMVLEYNNKKRLINIAGNFYYILNPHNEKCGQPIMIYDANIEGFTDDLVDESMFKEDRTINRVFTVKQGFRGDVFKLFKDENLELVWERKKPVKLTQFQYTILKKVSAKYKYLSRNSCGDLQLFIDKPKMFYNTGSWESKKCSSYILQELDDFDFIKWEDEKPTNIQELLDNCEVIE